ncbi:RNA polymerase sigma-70 factor [Mangrovibacterium sp.]|uniref:RNA polymerase sigma-70 factor n=1 Tax=Mangrovibacterium sp. TaxID=1961364 RepID=UPI00356433BE
MNIKANKRILKVPSKTEHKFESIFQTYFVRLCCFADRYTTNPEESKEIVQEVFLQVWNKREQLAFDREIHSYLFRAVKNGCLNLLQHKRIVDSYHAVLYLLYAREELHSDTYESLEISELSEKIDQAIQTLPDECRRIFLLSRENGLKYAEIAKELQISVKTVETQMSRALSRLRTYLKDYLN